VNETLEHTLPPIDPAPNWEDVLRRAHRARRRRVVAGCAVAFALCVTSVAVAAALGGFHAWLRGTPGRPASASAQRAFSVGHRSWLGFPATTQLRELTRTRVAGQTYVLYGFRSGDSLCLRLDASDLGRTIGPTCAPVSTVTHVSAPIVVVEAQTGFVDRASRPVATAGFGIAADDVAAVTVRTTESTYPARVDGNAYLWIESEPPTSERLLKLTAHLKNGHRVSIVPRSLFRLDTSRTTAPPPARGPSRVQARIPRPHLSHTGPTKPDPLSNIAVETNGAGLRLIIDGKTTAESSLGPLFAHGPIEFMIAGIGSDRFLTVAGVAADGVTRITVYLADGERQTAALRNNAFTATVPAVYGPIRVVALDRRHRVVGVRTFPPLFAGRPAPRVAIRNLRPILRSRGPEGAVARIAAGPTVRGTRCWRATFSNSSLGTGCQPPVWPPSGWTSVHADGHDVFIFGRVRIPNARVEIWFDNGDAIIAKKRDGFFLAAIPRTHLNRARQHAFVVKMVPSILGYDRMTSRQSIYYKELVAR
jgi:hypothetical protein